MCARSPEGAYHRCETRQTTDIHIYIQGGKLKIPIGAFEIVRAVSAQFGPKSKEMHPLDWGNTALGSDTAGFEFKPILENDILNM